MVLGGKLATKTSFSLSRPSSPRVEDLKGVALYGRLKEYLLTEDQLKENGYPFPHPERPGGAVIFTAEEKKPKDASCRICCRCGAEYLVSPSGRCVREEECYYHWGRLRRNRVAGGWETQYTCCSAAIGSTGCQVAKQHVQDGRKENLEGFVKTFDKELSEDAHPGVFALDCEMVSCVPRVLVAAGHPHPQLGAGVGLRIEQVRGRAAGSGGCRPRSGSGCESGLSPPAKQKLWLRRSARPRRADDAAAFTRDWRAHQGAAGA